MTLDLIRLEKHAEAPLPGAPPIPRKGWAAAVLRIDSIAGHGAHEARLADMGNEIGGLLARLTMSALGGSDDLVESYGKGAIVGAGVALSDAAALLHPKLGRPVREAIGRGSAIMPSTVKCGGPGARIDIPLHGVDDEWVFPLLDSVEAFVPNAPRADEMVVVVAMRVRSHAATGSTQGPA